MTAIADYWNDNVSNWKVANHLDPGSPAFFREVERYRFEKLDYLNGFSEFSDYAGKRVLDVGCGLGTDLSRFAANGAEVTGIDIAPRAVELARANFGWRGLQGRFEVMDGEAMGFPDDAFDFVYCHTVLHFTPHPKAMVGEIRRVLKPGGRALLMTINRRSWLYALHRVAGTKLDYMDAPVFHKMDRGAFAGVISAFPDAEIRFYRFPVRTEVHKGWKARVYNMAFVDLYRALPERLTGPTGYHMIAVVRK
ncbi:MAG: class I SAM-dependent methyltransferase [Paracoccaceae bacterium]|nr:class I SAM-dependent methyltransferase [Paracoccaceae bacterium]